MKLLFFFRSFLLLSLEIFLINFLCFMSEGESERKVKLVKEGERERALTRLFFYFYFLSLDD